MARYIDADEIDYTVTIVGEAENAGYRAVAFESDIDEMPTADAVEVVRCKDCKYWHSPTNDDMHYCKLRFGLQGIVAESDFCSYGKKEK